MQRKREQPKDRLTNEGDRLRLIYLLTGCLLWSQKRSGSHLNEGRVCRKAERKRTF